MDGGWWTKKRVASERFSLGKELCIVHCEFLKVQGIAVMKIISIARLEKKKDKFSVVFEDGAEIQVSAVQIADFGIYSGREIADDEYVELCGAIALSSSKAKSLRILGNRNMSAGEVKKRLVSRGVAVETAGETVEWLESVGAVDDKEYAAMIVRHYASKGYGLARIKDELYKRGIPRDIWDEAIPEIEGFTDAAQDFLEKKLRGSSDKDDIRRATDALCRRGFSYSEAIDAVRHYLDMMDRN